ncbi:MAG: GNAT family N-acetyltransferase [Armatimonadota bacterium]
MVILEGMPITLQMKTVGCGLSPELRATWMDLWCRLPCALPFHHADWFEAYFRTQPSRGTYVLTCERDGRPIGLIPIRQRTPWTAQVIAPLMDMQPLLILPGADDDLWMGLAEWLHSSQFAMLNLGRFDDAQAKQLAKQAQEHGLTPILRVVGPSLRTPLTTTWENYLAALPRTARYKVRRAERQIWEDFPDAEVRIHTDPAHSAPVIDTLIDLSCLRFATEKKRSYLADPRMASFYHQAISWIIAQENGALFTLHVMKRTIAVVTAVHQSGSDLAFYYLVGRDPCALPNTYCPGIALACHVIRWAITRKAQSLSLGLGVRRYKYDLGGVETPQYEVSIARSPILGKLLGKVDPVLHVAKDTARKYLPFFPGR